MLRRFGGDLAKEKRAAEEEVIVQLASLFQQESLSDEDRCEYTKLLNKWTAYINQKLREPKLDRENNG